MHPVIHIQSVFLRRCLLVLTSPLLLIMTIFIRLGKALMDAQAEIADMFSAIWKGTENEPDLLPCPFCGGKGMAHGWRTQSGATGPACEDCGATTWSTETWNTRIEIPEAVLLSVKNRQNKTEA